MKKQRKQKRKKCPHFRPEIRLLAVYCTCEVTAVFCKDCGKQISEEKWEC